jgi:PAS domain S-box-containing protein
LSSSSLLSENAFRLGYLWMAVCWSIALADRINLLKADTENANRQLRNSEHRLSQILEGLPLGVVVYGADQKPNFVNRRAVEILTHPDRGIQPDVSAGRSLAQAINYFSLKVSGSDELYPLENFPVFSALRGQPAIADDVEIDLGDTRVQLEIMASPVRDDSGNVESAVVVFQDISLRKQAETALRTSETRFRVIAENNFDGIAFMGHDRKVIYVSPSYLRLVGKTAEEMIGQSGVGLVHPEDRDYTANKFSEVLQQPNKRISAEYRIPHKDGSWVWVETFAINLLDDPDVQAVVLNSHNITERKHAEAELAEYGKHLESLVESRTVELSSANEQLQRHLKWLSGINLINQAMALSADFTRIYQQVIEIINNLFDTHGSFIVELDAGGKQLKTLAHSCQHKYNQVINGTFTTLPEGILSTSNPEGEIPLYLTIDQLHTLSGPMGAHLQEIKIQTIALMPLVLREKVYGYLGLELQEEGCLLTSEATDLLRIFSTDIAQLIENERAYEQSKALIAAQERNRLARDLHDSVTQVLFSATLLADVLPQLWRRDPELGLQRLDKLRKLTRGALAEMRTLLLELRPSAVINTPLGDLLAQLTEAVASRSGLPFQLFIEQTPSLPENVHTTFYRIAQEALNNVVKHAQARKVSVSLSDTPLPYDLTGVAGHEVRLVIQDDGVGYSTGVLWSDHMGISIMRERAAAIHAFLSLESQPGHGTEVTLIWSTDTGSQP